MIADHAVVLGGSIAGTLTARVLADRYRRVTVVDRDRFPAVGERRRGVPQDRHIHALQTRGARAIEQLFPGTTRELVQQGAVFSDWGRATMCFAGHRLRPVEAGLELLAASRPLLEGYLRTRLGRLPNVALHQHHDVIGLVLDPGGSTVTGVRIRQREEGSVPRTLRADLVVDATGRGSRLPSWLEELGYPTPKAEETGLEIIYTSCRFPREPGDPEAAIIVSAVPPHGRRGGGAIAAEDDTWVVTLGGVLGEQAPTDRKGFVDFASTLAIPDVHELVRDREPSSEPAVMRYPTGRRRRYDRLARFPERLLVTGDALCSFNPVYGQGMSVAAAEALALAACLDEGPDRIAQRFLDRTGEVVGDAWAMAAGGDANYVPELAERRSSGERLVSRYQRRMLAAAADDPVISRQFRAVMAMVARPQAVLRPRVAARVLGAALRRSRGHRQPVPAPGASAVAE